MEEKTMEKQTYEYRTFRDIMDSKEPLPYTFADLQHQVSQFVQLGEMPPEKVFGVMLNIYKTYSQFVRILNYTIAAEAEKAKKG
jgi:hypothetical protein